MKPPEESPDHLSLPIQYAGFVIRLKAFVFDYLIILAYIAALFGVNFGIILGGGVLEDISPLFSSPFVKDAIAFTTLILPVILYFALQEGSLRQSTWGKRKAGIRVANVDGGRLTRKQALVRSAVKFLPWQIAHTCIYHVEGWPLEVNTLSPLVMAGFVLVYVLVGIYIACVLISKKHRTPYDWAAGSYVIEGD